MNPGTVFIILQRGYIVAKPASVPMRVSIMIQIKDQRMYGGDVVSCVWLDAHALKRSNWKTQILMDQSIVWKK